MTPWTAARQAPLSVGFSGQEYWSGLPLPSPGDLPVPEIEPASPALQSHSLLSEPPEKPFFIEKPVSLVRAFRYHTRLVLLWGAQYVKINHDFRNNYLNLRFFQNIASLTRISACPAGAFSPLQKRQGALRAAAEALSTSHVLVPCLGAHVGASKTRVQVAPRHCVCVLGCPLSLNHTCDVSDKTVRSK